MLGALLCWQLDTCGGAVEPKVDGGVVMRVTAYCACEKCCGRWADGITASGHIIVRDDCFVAAPRSLPFGTMLIVPGYNAGEPVPVRDRGGAITEGRIDVFFGTHQQALEWGVQLLRVREVKTE